MRVMLARRLQTVCVSLVLLIALVGVVLWAPILVTLTAVTNARSLRHLLSSVCRLPHTGSAQSAFRTVPRATDLIWPAGRDGVHQWSDHHPWPRRA
jgi:hypothetical protein